MAKRPQPRLAAVMIKFDQLVIELHFADVYSTTP